MANRVYSDKNRSEFIGRVVRDAEAREVMRKDGTKTAVTSFTVACNKSVVSEDGTILSRRSVFVDVSFWNRPPHNFMQNSLLSGSGRPWAARWCCFQNVCASVRAAGHPLTNGVSPSALFPAPYHVRQAAFNLNLFSPMTCASEKTPLWPQVYA